MALRPRLATYPKSNALPQLLAPTFVHRPDSAITGRARCRKQKCRQRPERILRSGMELRNGTEPRPRLLPGRSALERSVGRPNPGSDPETRGPRKGNARPAEEN